jgi:hypothetical protein
MKSLTNSTASNSPVGLNAWLVAMPVQPQGKVRLNVTLQLQPEELGIIAGAMMKQRASLAAIVTHALWEHDALLDVARSDLPVDGVYGTAQCPECHDFDSALEAVIGVESGKPVATECRCIECGRVL